MGLIPHRGKWTHGVAFTSSNYQHTFCTVCWPL